jgi:hypothetical protein
MFNGVHHLQLLAAQAVIDAIGRAVLAENVGKLQ